jgi:hypothetical protein
LRKSIFAEPIESISKARNVLADEVNPLHSLLADCVARRTGNDERITRLFLQRSELIKRTRQGRSSTREKAARKIRNGER